MAHLRCNQSLLIIPMDELDSETQEKIRKNHNQFIIDGFWTRDMDNSGFHIDCYDEPAGIIAILQRELDTVMEDLRIGKYVEDERLYIACYYPDLLKKYPDYKKWFNEDGDFQRAD